MVELLAADDARGYGVALALGLEGIGYRRLRRVDGGNGLLLIARPLAPAELAALATTRRPAVVLSPVEEREVIEHHPIVSVSLDAPLWPERVRKVATAHGISALSVPSAGVVNSPGIAGEVLATMVLDGKGTIPAVVRAGRTIRSFVDVGAALADLVREAYLPETRTRALAGPAARAALAVYYRAPERLRQQAQRRAYSRLASRLAALGPRASSYPVDGTGWLLLELVKALLRAAGSRLVRLAHWPFPFGSAAILTHDIEPTRFAYGPGLRTLCDRLARMGHPGTFGLVSVAAQRFLPDGLPPVVKDREVFCHGLAHRGETLVGARHDVLQRLERARAMLAAQLGRPIEGFRSPRLDRSPALLWALDWAGFLWDSSYPDVDRENLDHFGGGVRLCLPYRPPLQEGKQVRASRCLELPVSAPDCIQPLFQGHDLRALRRAVRAKTAFVRDTGGLYVGIVHAGVFDRRDARRRGAHLEFVHRMVDRPDVWLTSPRDLTRWWRAREGVLLESGEREVTAQNCGLAPVAGLALTIDDGDEERVIPVPTLQAGKRTVLGIPPPQAAGQQMA